MPLIRAKQLDIDEIASDLDLSSNVQGKRIVESLLGSINGSNKTFKTSHKFILNTTCVFYNGQKLRKDYHYVEQDDETIIFSFAPLSDAFTDELNVVYEQQGTSSGTTIIEELIGTINNANNVFTSTYDFLLGSVELYYNGLFISEHNYTITGSNQITFDFVPLNTGGMTDELSIIYTKL